jgi:hypothetical protein
MAMTSQHRKLQGCRTLRSITSWNAGQGSQSAAYEDCERTAPPYIHPSSNMQRNLSEVEDGQGRAQANFSVGHWSGFEGLCRQGLHACCGLGASERASGGRSCRVRVSTGNCRCMQFVVASMRGCFRPALCMRTPYADAFVVLSSTTIMR